MTEAEAMAVLVAGISAYGRREKALAAAGHCSAAVTVGIHVDGADDAATRLRIITAVKVHTGFGTDHITVLKRNR